MLHGVISKPLVFTTIYFGKSFKTPHINPKEHFFWDTIINPLSTNPQKWPNTLRIKRLLPIHQH